MRAVSELNQAAMYVIQSEGEDTELADYHYQISAWMRTPPAERDDTYNYLLPSSDLALTKQSDYSLACASGGEVDYLRQQVEDKGMEMLLLDQTRPDIGLPVVKVIVPGLRHFWCRLGAGRLYDVPVAQGLRSEKITEAEDESHQQLLVTCVACSITKAFGIVRSG